MWAPACAKAHQPGSKCRSQRATCGSSVLLPHVLGIKFGSLGLVAGTSPTDRAFGSSSLPYVGSFQAHTSGQEPSPAGVGFEAQDISCLFRNQFFCLWLSCVIIVHFQVLLAMIFLPPSLRLEMIWTVRVSLCLPSKFFLELLMISRWFSNRESELQHRALTVSICT